MKFSHSYFETVAKFYLPFPPPKFTVARLYIFKPKIPIWVNFGGSCNRRCWYILWPFGLLYCNLVYFAVIWYTYFPRFCMLYQEKSGNPASTVHLYLHMCSNPYQEKVVGRNVFFEQSLFSKYFTRTQEIPDYCVRMNRTQCDQMSL
jgi:hypothetical protein